MKRKIVLAVLLAFMTVCSGCALIDFDTQNIMRPPRATGNKAGIQQVLEEYAGKNITLKYPQKGEYRSAVIFYDVKGNGGQQAIAFYSPNGTAAAAETHMMVMDEMDGKWQKVNDYSNPGTEVDRVCFGDLNGDGVKEIIVGWSNTYDSISNKLTVFGYTDAGVQQYESDYTYTELGVMDFDNDSSDEILLTSLTIVDTPAAARLIKMSKETSVLSSAGVVDLDPAVTKYASVTVGKIAQGQFGMVLDGYRQSNLLATEIVYWDAGRGVLRAPLYNSNFLDFNYTVRRTATVSKDIDDDGIIEIPIVSPMVGYSLRVSNDTESPCYITDWRKYDTKTGTFLPVVSMVANYADGYYFIIPEEWKNTVTAKMETETRTLTFYAWEVNESGIGAAGVAILKIQVFSKQEWTDAKGTADFTFLVERDDKIYAAAVPQPDNQYVISFANIQKNFTLINVF